MCRSGEPKHSFFYDERGGKRVATNVRETKFCVDCWAVILACFTEAELASLQSLKPLRERAWVALWLTSRSVRCRLTAAEFFAERRAEKK